MESLQYRQISPTEGKINIFEKKVRMVFRMRDFFGRCARKSSCRKGAWRATTETLSRCVFTAIEPAD